MKYIVKIALRNCWCYKKITTKIIIAFCALLFLITLFPSFIFSTQDKQNEFKTSYISANYIVSNSLIDSSAIDGLQYSNKFEHIDIASSADEIFGTAMSYLPRNMVEFEIDSKIYKSFNHTDGVFVYSTSDNDIFNKNDFLEYGTGDKSSFIVGNFPQNSNEIMLAEYMVQDYNIQEDAIGKNISMLSTAKDREIFKDMTICGIIKMDYFSLSGHINQFSQFAPSLLVHTSNSICSIYEKQMQYIYTLDEWPSKEVLEYFDSNDLKYMGIYYLQEIHDIQKIQNMLLQLFLYVGIALIFGIALIISLLMYKLLEKLTKNNGILLASGINNTQLLGVWLVQLLTISVISLIVAIFLIAIGYLAINSLLAYNFGVKYVLAISRIGVLFSIGLGAIFIFSALSIFAFYISLNKKTIRVLVDS